MTRDVIVLTPRMPDTWRLLASLYGGGPDQYVASTADGAVIHLLGRGGRPLVSVEAPVLVQVPGEVARLLGAQAGARSEAQAPVHAQVHAQAQAQASVPAHAPQGAAPTPAVASATPEAGPPLVAAPPAGPGGGPVWWTEIRASTAVPEASALAGSVAGRLALLLGGVCHPPEAVTSLGVVPLDSERPVAAPVAGDALPAVDVVTDSTVVVITDRPLVALSAWLSDVVRLCAETDRALQIVTPPGSRLSMITRFALSGAPNRWVVGDSAGYHDGLSGATLHWHDGTFTPLLAPDGTATVAAAFTPPGPTAERQLSVSFRTAYAPDGDLVLGRSLETAWRTLTGAPPVGWGTAEPVNLPWSTRQLTELARGRMPRPTLLTVVGDPERPALATVRVTRTGVGVVEDVTLLLGYDAGEPLPLDGIEPLAADLVADHQLASMLTLVRTAERDLTVPPVFRTPPVPVSFTLGAKGVAEVTLTRARRPPLEPRPVQLGQKSAPALHYALGDGTDPAAWGGLRVLTEHLGQPVT